MWFDQQDAALPSLAVEAAAQAHGVDKPKAVIRASVALSMALPMALRSVDGLFERRHLDKSFKIK
jgi:hypothetical protein